MPIASAHDVPHLAGPGAPVRQVIAAHYLRPCRNIVEIGGAGLPLTDFLTHDTDSVTVIDPKITPLHDQDRRGQHRVVRHIAAKFQAVALPLPENLGVAILGLSLKPEGALVAEDEKLLALLRRADVAVIEYALDLPRALEQVPSLLGHAGLRTIVSIDFTIEDGVIETYAFARRRLMVLSRSQ